MCHSLRRLLLNVAIVLIVTSVAILFAPRIAVAGLGHPTNIASKPCYSIFQHDLTPQQIADLAAPAVVRITAKDAAGTPESFGSGFVVGKNLIATCWHVVSGAYMVTANFSDGRSVSVPGLIGYDSKHDVAVISVETANIKPLILTFELPPLGAPVVAVGNPEGLSDTISTGVVSGRRMINSIDTVQTTAPISPGSSGGPLIDSHGYVIGLIQSHLIEGENLNFAVVSVYVRPFMYEHSHNLTTWITLIERQAIQNASLFCFYHYNTATKSFDPVDLNRIKAALGSGANVNARNNSPGELHETAIMEAADLGNVDLVRLLLDHRADVNLKDDNGSTAVLNAAASDKANAIRILLANGADVNAKDGLGNTPLMECMFSHPSSKINGSEIDHLRCLQLLIAHGADVNAKDSDGSTAIIIGAWGGGDLDGIKYLINVGADVNVKDNDGATALSIAKDWAAIDQSPNDQKVNQDTVDALLAAGATD
jgi:hypothetical protein